MEKTVNLAITGMGCQSCITHIESAVKSVGGVHTVEINLAKKSAQVTMNAPTETEMMSITKKLIQSISEAGYTAVAS